MNKTEVKPTLSKPIRDPERTQISLKGAEPRESTEKTRSCSKPALCMLKINYCSWEVTLQTEHEGSRDCIFFSCLICYVQFSFQAHKYIYMFWWFFF